MAYDTISPPVTPVFEPVTTTSHYAEALIHFSRQLPPEQAADRAKQEAQRLLRPDVYGVVGWTLLFGVLGIFSVSRRSAKANAVGLPTGRYWVAFVATVLVQVALLLAVNTYANGSA
jgi:hypothetical protein